MPEIHFDGKKVEVPAGTNLIEAGHAAGVPVPVFCYHKDLGAVGSCRVCAVTVRSGGKERLVMGCMTEAQDGMEVTTQDPASAGLRKSVVEWLMENHPHDCPICDEGGECQLQDLTIACGHGVRRYGAPKRTFENQHLGEFIQHEMNRCITCYRCSRFYQEYAGGRDFGSTGSRDRVYFGRFEEGPFESPFSGNLVELCPTGVFTDKLFRYKSRVWDLEIAPSVCPHCSVGCNILAGARHRMLQRVRVRENPAVNGAFLCDRGQFGHGYVMDEARPRQVRLAGAHCVWERALEVAASELVRVAGASGAASVAVIASSRAALETHVALAALAGGPLAGTRVAHFDDPERETRAIACLDALADATATSGGRVQPLDQGDIAHCDVLIVAGASLVDEAPLAALSARQVARRNGRVFVLNAGEQYLADVARTISVHPADLAAQLEAIAKGIGGSPDGTPAGEVAAALAAAERPGLLLGSDLLDGPAIAAGAGLARAIAATGKHVRFGTLFPGPNGFGAAAIAPHASCEAVLADLESGKLRALLLVEADLDAWSDKTRAALAKLDALVTLDHLPGVAAEAAHILLPTTATYESHGTFVNRAGRAQAFAPARGPGLSVIQLIEPNGNFPRTYRPEAPESEARPAAWIVEQLRARIQGKPAARTIDQLRASLAHGTHGWQALAGLRAGDDGAPLDPAALRAGGAARASVAAFARPSRGLAVFRLDRTLGSETLSRRSAPMRKMAGPAVVRLAPADAVRLGLNGRAAIESAGATVEAAVEGRASVPEGVVLVSRDAAWSVRPAQGATASVTSAAAEEVKA